MVHLSWGLTAYWSFFPCKVRLLVAQAGRDKRDPARLQSISHLIAVINSMPTILGISMSLYLLPIMITCFS